MPAAARRRRTPFDVRRRTAIAAAAVLVLLLAGCTGHRDTGVHPQPQPDQSPPTATAGASGVPATRTIADTGGAPNLSALLNYPRVFAALAVVPENAAEISFTDVRSVKERLGFASLTSNSAHAEHVAFWRRAEADGSMFNGSALNAFERTMSRDFGWTGDDVDWEVDFATVETGCLRSMLCSTGRGRVFGLRPGLDWSVVTDSLARSGFTPDITPNGSLVNRTRLAPFQRVLPIAGLHAVATGNSRGLARIGAVLEGAPTFGRRLANFSRSLPTVESMHVSGGCVTLDSALPVPRRHRAPVPVPPDEVRRLAAAETVAVIVDKD
ncbi:MAG TPA: hypothetical protein VH419_00780, partial [Nocardioidaceae bacterium]